VPPVATVVDAIAITQSPVDPLSLANNLYGAGEYELALHSYIELSESGELSPHDQVWARYQIGNCYHHLGNQPEAQRSLRRVASVEEKSLWGQHAHWWLDTNERTNRLQTQVRETQIQIEQLKGQSNEPNKP
jgi:tetratricopeptide (TPR) repeat protein